MNLLISPHDDDSHLIACYTLIREKPLVVVCTDSYIQHLRGELGCDAETRAKETEAACKAVGCASIRLGIRDDSVTDEALSKAFRGFTGFEKIYIPAVQGGNTCHDAVGRVGKDCFPQAIRYTTYTKTELWTRGTTELIPSEEEKTLKIKSLNCYQSQINLPATRPHFLAVANKSEWYD